MKAAYLSPSEDLVDELCKEVGRVEAVHDRLVISHNVVDSHWAQNIWHNPERISIGSVSDAAKKLKAIQRNWALYSTNNHRRAQLIQEQLPHVSAKPLSFLSPVPSAALGSWTLLDEKTVLASPYCSSAFPNGEVKFKEDKTNPPSRAYLKLWEAFTVYGAYPKKGERVLEVGACPGGWTWVLNNLEADITAVDRSPLAPALMKQSNIKFQKGDAFSILPKTHGNFDWIFSDLACYPDKLYTWVKEWLDSGQVKNLICTLKFQGKTNYGAISSFKKIPGSKLVHLYENKHELTWMKTE